MLRPKKSQLAVFGLTRHPENVRHGSNLVPCENCSLPGCQYRRAPYRHFMPQAEPVGRLQGRGNEAQAARTVTPGGLDRGARYSVNRRALEKWAAERLRLDIAGDGSVTARFRYDGTTCANLGQPLQYEYLVRLGPPAQFYRVLELHCAPAAGDTGHTQMCEYLKDAQGLLRRIEAEKPLFPLGKQQGFVGFAWHLTAGKVPVVWHNGGTGGYRSFIGYQPTKKRGIAVLANSSRSVDMLGMQLLKDAILFRIKPFPLN